MDNCKKGKRGREMGSGAVSPSRERTPAYGRKKLNHRVWIVKGKDVPEHTQ